MDLDLRKARYFVAVAEHSSFVRAAEALHIAQPVLSRQIRSLENEFGATLFDRGPRGTRLTAAGEVMLEEARGLLMTTEALRRRVRDAAAGLRRFTVGFTPGVSIAPAVREFSAGHADVSVEVVRMDFFQRADAVRRGEVDVGYLRLPIGSHGLSIEPLFTEPQVVELPAGHRLAGRDAVRMAELRDERMLLDYVPAWREATAAPPAGRPGEPILDARSIEELLEHVAAGRGVVVVPLSTAEYFARADIAHVRVDDIPPSHVGLAWRSARRSALIEEYLDIARRTPAQPESA